MICFIKKTRSEIQRFRSCNATHYGLPSHHKHSSWTTTPFALSNIISCYFSLPLQPNPIWFTRAPTRQTHAMDRSNVIVTPSISPHNEYGWPPLMLSCYSTFALSQILDRELQNINLWWLDTFQTITSFYVELQ